MSIYRTRDFTALTPSYVDVTGAVSGVIQGMVLDPYTPRDTAYVITTQGFWRTRNLNDEFPGWGQFFSLTDRINAGLLPAFKRMQATIAFQGRVYCLAWAKQNSSPATVMYDQFVFRTDNGGETFQKFPTGGAGGGTDQFDFDDDMEGWAYTTDRTVPIGIAQGGDCDYTSIAYGDWWSWEASGGRTTPGCLYALKSGSQPSFFEPGASTVKYDISTIVAENDVALDVWYNPDPLTFSPNLLLRVFFTDNTVQDLFVGVGGTGYQNAQLVISAANAGKMTSYVMLGWCICGFDWTGDNGVYIDDVKVFGVGTGAPISSALAVGQHNAARVYVSSTGLILRSSDAGQTWGTYISQGAHDIECPYLANPNDDNLNFIGTDGRFYTTVGSTPTVRAGWGIEEPVSIGGRIVTGVSESVIYTLFHDGSDLFSVKRTLNGGATWDTRSSGHPNARAIGLWPYNADIVYMLTDDGPQYSLDGGATFANKVGDIAGFSEQNYIVPVWIE